MYYIFTVFLTNLEQLHGSWSLLDVRDDFALVTCSAPNRPPIMLLGRIPDQGKENTVDFFK